MLKDRNDEIGFILVILIVCFLANGLGGVMRIVCVIGGLVAILFIANLIFDLIDTVKESRNKKHK